MQFCTFQSTHPTKGDTLQSNVFNLTLNFNPLIPYREIRQYCTKMHRYILAVLPKTHLLSLSAASETLKIPRISRKNNLYSGANPPRFSCELQVRTMMIFAIHSYLLLLHIASPLPFSMYLLVLTISKRRQPDIFARKNTKQIPSDMIFIREGSICLIH